MPKSAPLTFRAYISPRPGNRFLVTVMSPLLSAPLHRNYPADMGADAAVERAVAHAAAIVTALLSGQRVRVTWQGVLGWKPHKQTPRGEEQHLRLSPCCQKGTVKD
ncbi:hypothetical protein DSECCO2_131410 [anaerobic digester metagenome]